MRTRFGICTKKTRFASLDAALSASRNVPFALRPYRCSLCRQYHLTSRTKGMFNRARPTRHPSPEPGPA